MIAAQSFRLGGTAYQAVQRGNLPRCSASTLQPFNVFLRPMRPISAGIVQIICVYLRHLRTKLMKAIEGNSRLFDTPRAPAPCLNLTAISHQLTYESSQIQTQIKTN